MFAAKILSQSASSFSRLVPNSGLGPAQAESKTTANNPDAAQWNLGFIRRRNRYDFRMSLFEPWRAPSLLKPFRRPQMPIGRLLILMRDVQQARFVEIIAHQLQTHWALANKADGY